MHRECAIVCDVYRQNYPDFRNHFMDTGESLGRFRRRMNVGVNYNRPGFYSLFDIPLFRAVPERSITTLMTRAPARFTWASGPC